jgi:hypothetical protein
LLAITTPTNHASQKLLGRVGLRFESEIEMATETLHLFAVELTETESSHANA